MAALESAIAANHSTRRGFTQRHAANPAITSIGTARIQTVVHGALTAHPLVWKCSPTPRATPITPSAAAAPLRLRN
jgi:hypothetical protein